ncbi:MAG: indole-3-glycerol phosphate synthase TrpC [Bacteroidetes bacterium]|nr:MAG: indole-3-glycerol phosphate synthase TrpC [Bacteroidota bacterium]
MDLLKEIVAHKHTEVARRKQNISQDRLKKSGYFKMECDSLVAALGYESSTGIIAEFKRKSPSKGVINDIADVGYVVSEYDTYGAAAVSILTDKKYFGGSLGDIPDSRDSALCPILRKDFIVDEYQVYETKACGADVMLLIAACLTPDTVRHLAGLAKSLGLEVLLEIHTEAELEHICPEVDVVGINNRNLRNFEVDLEHSIQLASKLPPDKPKIAESGISNTDTILTLEQHGFSGFLIGETFMKHPQPEIAFAEFVQELKQKKQARQGK